MHIESDIVELTADVKALGGKRDDTNERMNSGFAAIRADMNAESKSVRAEMNSGFTALRADMNAGFSSLKDNISALRLEIVRTKFWMLATGYSVAAILVGVMARGFKWI